MNRPAAPGFGALFCFSVAKALAPPLNEADLILPVLRLREPPTSCPACGFRATEPRRVDGEWTWCCLGGCNP